MSMFAASQAKSDASMSIITKALKAKVDNYNDYTIVYGFGMKSGLFSKKMFNYAIGFNSERKELVIVPINSDGDILSDAILVNKGNFTSAKKTTQGGWRIATSSLEKPIDVCVPGFLADSAEDAYQLPINQTDAANEFSAIMRAF